MGRLKTLGLGVRSVTAGHEIDSTSGTTPTIDTVTTRTGGDSVKINTTAGNTGYIKVQYRSASSNKIFARIYINIPSSPTSNGTILGLVDTGETDQGGGLKLNTDNTVSLIGGSGTGFATIGSPSSALSTNTWYRLEITYDDSNANNTLVAFLDGVQFATGNGQDMGGNSVAITLGDIDAVGMVAYFDDIAINDSAGSFQNGLPGDGKVIYLVPDAAGDVNTFATQTGGTAGASNNFTRVNETTPDDATSFNGSSTLNQEDLFNCGASGIGASDTVNVVEVHGRFRNSTADATAKITFEIEKTASGTKTSSSAITPNSTTWRTNVPGTTLPKTAVIITYQDPDAAAWTQTTLDSMQIGYKLTTGPGTAGRRIDVTKVWAVVDYTPAAATTTSTSSTSSSTSTSQSTSTSASTSSTSTSHSTSTSQSTSTSSTSTSQSTSTTHSTSSTSSSTSQSTSTSVSTSSTSTSQSTSTSASTSLSTSTTTSTSTSSTSSSTSTSASTSSTSSSTSQSTSTSLSTSTTTSTSTSSTSTSTSSTSSSTSSTTTIAADTTVKPSIKQPHLDPRIRMSKLRISIARGDRFK